MGLPHFTVKVDKIGDFTFKRRTLADELAIAAEFSRISKGVETPTKFLNDFGGAVAALIVLTVRGPDDWDPLAMDALDDDCYTNVILVHGALRAREEEFRAAKKKPSEAPGTPTGEVDRVLVSPDISAAPF